MFTAIIDINSAAGYPAHPASCFRFAAGYWYGPVHPQSRQPDEEKDGLHIQFVQPFTGRNRPAGMTGSPFHQGPRFLFAGGF